METAASVRGKTLSFGFNKNTYTITLALALAQMHLHSHLHSHSHTLAHVALHLRRCKWEKFASRVFGVIFRHQLYLDCKVLGDGGCYCSSCRSCSWWQKPALDTPSPERPPSPSRKVYLKIKNVWRLRGRSLKLRLL